MEAVFTGRLFAILALVALIGNRHFVLPSSTTAPFQFDGKSAVGFPCGHSCIWAFMEGALAHEEIPRPACTWDQAWSLEDLCDSAEAIGVSAFPSQCSLEGLATSLSGGKRAGVLHVDGEHFVLVRRISEREFALFDPAIGEGVTIDFNELAQRHDWLGVVVFLERNPTGEFKGL